MSATAERPSYVYRLSDESGQVLYIGCADNVKMRLAHHARNQPWWDQVSAIDVEQYPTRDLAIQAEREAIAAEQPPGNIRGTQRGMGRPGAKKLVNLDLERLNINAVAFLMKSKPATIRGYMSRGQMPAPSECPCCTNKLTWDKTEITAWIAQRQGRTGRPRKEQGATGA